MQTNLRWIGTGRLNAADNFTFFLSDFSIFSRLMIGIASKATAVTASAGTIVASVTITSLP
jgi:hypothetical protein